MKSLFANPLLAADSIGGRVFSRSFSARYYWFAFFRGWVTG